MAFTGEKLTFQLHHVLHLVCWPFLIAHWKEAWELFSRLLKLEKEVRMGELSKVIGLAKEIPELAPGVEKLFTDIEVVINDIAALKAALADKL